MSYNITCVEFFDSTDIENICVALTGTIDRIILFGSRKTPMDAAKKHYEKVLAARKYSTQISVEVVKDNCENFFATVVDGLEQLALRYGTGTDAEGRENVCMFDLTGGEDLPLVAAGIVYERVRERCNIQMHRFNLATTKPEKLVVNFDETSAQTFLEGFQPQLSVAEYLRFAGAKVIEEAFAWPDEALHPEDAAYRAYVTEFRADVKKLWNVCRNNPKLWNNRFGMLQKEIVEVYEKGNTRGIIVEDNSISIEKNTPSISDLGGLIRELNAESKAVNAAAGSDKYFYISEDANTYVLHFKNADIMRLLSNAGRLLELYVYVLGKELQAEGEFNDVRTGVQIDWDGELDKETRNEIDVMFMRGTVPVYISCKNGDFDSDEMYKVSTVAHNFGRKYAKKVIVSAVFSLFDPEKRRSLSERADNMNVRLVKDAAKLEESEFKKALKELWKNGPAA